MADEAKKALVRTGKEAAIRSGRVLFVGFDGTETMIKELNSGTFGATMEVDFESMCECAANVYENSCYRTDPYSIAATLRTQAAGQSA
jgi:ABC-type sugar transport system substrate-binding protein